MGNGQISNHDVLRSWAIDCKGMASQNSLLHYAGEQTRSEAFWSTLTVDKNDRGEFVTAGLEQIFRRYINSANNLEWPGAFSASPGRPSALFEDTSWARDVSRYADALARACQGLKFSIDRLGE